MPRPPPLLAFTCLLPDPLGFLPNHGGLLPTSLSAAPSARSKATVPVPSPYLLSKAPLLREQEPVAKGGRQARRQVWLALRSVRGMLASGAAREAARLLRVSV